MYPENTPRVPAQRAGEVHHPKPIVRIVPVSVPLVPVQPDSLPTVASVVLPDGRVVTGYAVNPVQPEPLEAKPTLSRTAVNVALGGVGFLAVCGGLLLLTTFIAALAALIQQLVILAAVIFGGFIALQVLGHRPRGGAGTTVNIRKAVIKRNHFRG
ncbi:hypothetical protein [Streptomyces sp. NPDC096152]|uniref:hypothetical protein n=1 Tax=Streptomyces sp. NPDC096152 TaxID=3366078 RepID=UPI0038307712